MPCMKWTQNPSCRPLPQLPCGLPGPLLLNETLPHDSGHLLISLSKSAAHALLHHLTVPHSRDPRAGRAEGCSMLCVPSLGRRSISVSYCDHITESLLPQ